MKIYEARLSITTPAFVGGARPRAADPITPLRPPSIRGALRMWFRMAFAGLVKPQAQTPQGRQEAIRRLRHCESYLFGAARDDSAADRGDRTALSETIGATRVRVLPPQGATIREIANPGTNTGLGYLGYGPFQHNQTNPTAVVGQDIQLRFGIDPRRTNTLEIDRDVLAATLWMWTTFGGLGSRNRRGFGSLHLASPLTELGGGDPLIPTDHLLKNLRTSEDLMRAVVGGMTWVYRVFTAFIHKRYPDAAATLLKGGTPHPGMRTIRGLRQVRVLPATWRTADEAHEQIGRLFMDFRSSIRRPKRGARPLPDYFEVKGFLEGDPGRPQHVDRAAFGLPIQFRYRSVGGRSAMVLPAEEDGRDKTDRIASGLIFRIHPIANGYTAALFYFDEAEGADPLQTRKMKMKGGRATIRPPQKGMVIAFLDWAHGEAQRRARPQRAPHGGGRR